jgi:hypothetical protein
MPLSDTVTAKTCLDKNTRLFVDPGQQSEKSNLCSGLFKLALAIPEIENRLRSIGRHLSLFSRGFANFLNINFRLLIFKSPVGRKGKGTMRFNGIWPSLLIILLPVSAFPVMAQTTSLDQMDRPVLEKEVRQFLDAYTSHYMKKDIYKFMTLFSKKAVENRMLPYADIRQTYRKNFDDSDSLKYDLEIISIQPYRKSAFVSGRYRVVKAIKSEKGKRIVQGKIQWYLVRERGSLKIREINYGRNLTQ